MRIHCISAWQDCRELGYYYEVDFCITPQIHVAVVPNLSGIRRIPLYVGRRLMLQSWQLIMPLALLSEFEIDADDSEAQHDWVCLAL